MTAREHVATWPVWGHEAAAIGLAQAIATNRVRHAYLLSGPEGVGKATLALTFAQALCCLEPPAPGQPCGHCRSCGKIGRGVHPDVQTFDIASQSAGGGKPATKSTTLTIETIRALAATASLRPLEAAWRVIVIDDAEFMQETAQEALLKTLEEPPPYAVLILLVNDVELLLPTVRSRCQVIELAPVPRSTIHRGLKAQGIGDERANDLAAAAGGSPGWAIRAAQEPNLIRERRESIERAVNWIRAMPFERVATAIRLGDGFAKRRVAVFADLEVLLGVWRDAVRLHLDIATETLFSTQAEELSSISRPWSLPAIHGALCSVRRCIADLEANVRPRLAIEAMVLQWPTI